MANITDIRGAITHLFHTHNGESLSDEEIKVCVDHIVYWFGANGVWSISYITKPKKG